jgi:hypothetical protein
MSNNNGHTKTGWIAIAFLFITIIPQTTIQINSFKNKKAEEEKYAKEHTGWLTVASFDDKNNLRSSYLRLPKTTKSDEIKPSKEEIYSVGDATTYFLLVHTKKPENCEQANNWVKQGQKSRDLANFRMLPDDRVKILEI